MLNEKQEFRAYTGMVIYDAANKRDTAFLGRFTLDMILDFKGLSRVLTILARGYLDMGKTPEEVRMALCAWCSIPDGKAESKKKSERAAVAETDFRTLHSTYPELVNENGEGWFCRHVHSITGFILQNPKKVNKSCIAKAEAIQAKWDAQWRKKVLQLQVPLYHTETKGAWVLRFDDVIASALADKEEYGKLRGEAPELPNKWAERLSHIDTGIVPLHCLSALIRYYLANKPEDSDWVVLPVTNFDAYFGSTMFSKKWLNALPTEIFEKQTQGGICRYRICGK